MGTRPANKIPLSARRKKLESPFQNENLQHRSARRRRHRPEVMREAIKVLRATEKKFGFQLNITEAPVGWAGIDAAGKALPDATLALCKKSDAILFGSVGLPDRDPTIPKEERPERAALLRLRKEFGLFANLRPVSLPKVLSHACPLAKERQGDGIDILVVRELTGGMYFGQPKKTEDLGGGNFRAIDTMVYTTPEIERIAHVAFQAAQLRRKKLTSIDKANVLENGILWREVVTRVGKNYPDVTLEHMFVDNGAMQLMLKPTQFDVMLCENMFGDILSDEAAALGGSLGMLPSASLGATNGEQTFWFLRTRRRHRAGHRRKKPGEPDRADFVERADAAAQLRFERRGGGD
jgi:3-isopropylmalate dehydrogenase